MSTDEISHLILPVQEVSGVGWRLVFVEILQLGAQSMITWQAANL